MIAGRRAGSAQSAERRCRRRSKRSRNSAAGSLPEPLFAAFVCVAAPPGRHGSADLGLASAITCTGRPAGVPAEGRRAARRCSQHLAPGTQEGRRIERLQSRSNAPASGRCRIQARAGCASAAPPASAPAGTRPRFCRAGERQGVELSLASVAASGKSAGVMPPAQALAHAQSASAAWPRTSPAASACMVSAQYRRASSRPGRARPSDAFQRQREIMGECGCKPGRRCSSGQRRKAACPGAAGASNRPR